ncbi:MAG TPA: FkbM family methyltransferase, partial [Rhodopila sp.]
MQKQIFEFMGRRIELWTHPEPDHMGRLIRGNRTFYELDVLMKCREIYLPGTAVVDVGANIGNHAVFFGAVLNAPVYAFEPYPPNFELLQMNIAANGLDGQVVPACCAVGEDDGMGSVHPGPAENLGVTRIAFGGGDVPVHTLDSLKLQGPIGLMKIDVEGAEAAVLRGASRMIGDWSPDIVVEAGDADAFRSVAATLWNFGYTPRGRYAATPTYLFTALDQARRIEQILT